MRRLTGFIASIALLLMGPAGVAQACFGGAPATHTSPEALMNNASAVYLARVALIENERPPAPADADEQPLARPVVEDEPVPTIQRLLERVRSNSVQTRTRFQVLETLHGPAKDTLQMSRHAASRPDVQTTFNDHTAPDFWSDIRQGRVVIDASCAPQATFEVNAVYLIIESDQETVKSYERIDKVDEDAWLAFARDYFAE